MEWGWGIIKKIIRKVIPRQDFLYGVGKRAWNSGFTGGMGKRSLYTGSICVVKCFQKSKVFLTLLQMQSRTEIYKHILEGKELCSYFYFWYYCVFNKTEAGFKSGT